MPQNIITQEVIENFLENLQLQQKSEKVVSEYRRELKNFQNMLLDQEGVLSKEGLVKWHEMLKEKGLAPGTITNRVVRMNHFLRYIGREDLCFRNGGRKNLTGMQFGNLVAIEPTERRSTDRSIYWKCRCNACGKEKEIPANQLTKGVQVSCGCERSKRLKKTNGYVDGTCLKRVFTEKLNSNNTSGYKGVFRKRGKWAAAIQYKKKTYYLGSYDLLEDAIRARQIAEKQVREDAVHLMKRENIINRK